MSPLDLPANNVEDVAPPYAAIVEVQVPESSSYPDRLRVTLDKGVASALVVTVPESGPPLWEHTLIDLPNDDDDFFDEVRKFVADGSLDAHLGHEAPDIKVEWDL